eukprot:7500236-Karenia_brevis.AAC.1
MPGFAKLCFAMLRYADAHAQLCCAKLRYALQCSAVLCHADANACLCLAMLIWDAGDGMLNSLAVEKPNTTKERADHRLPTTAGLMLLMM